MVTRYEDELRRRDFEERAPERRAAWRREEWEKSCRAAYDEIARLADSCGDKADFANRVLQIVGETEKKKP